MDLLLATSKLCPVPPQSLLNIAEAHLLFKDLKDGCGIVKHILSDPRLSDDFKAHISNCQRCVTVLRSCQFLLRLTRNWLSGVYPSNVCELSGETGCLH